MERSSAVQALDRGGALPHRGAHAVHRRVAAADHHDALAVRVQRAVLEFRHGIAEVLPGRGGQVVDGAHDAVDLAVIAVQLARLVDARRHDHRVVRLADLGEGDVAADLAAQPEGHAAIGQLRVAPLDDVLLQLEAGDAVAHQPAGAVVAVVDRHLDARAAQRVRGRQPAGAGADDADALGAFHARRDGADPAFVVGRVGDVLLDRPDGDRAVTGLLDHAVALAEPVLRADAPADLGEGIGLLRDLVGFPQAPLGGHPQPVGDVVVQRAMRLAVGHAALGAARRLLGCPLGRKLPVDLAEVVLALLRAALLRHLPGDVHELQHAVASHRRALPVGPPISKVRTDIKSVMLS